MVKNIRISDFDYDLPDDRIARHPLSKRDSCKLLVAQGEESINHHTFADLPGLLPAGSLLVCNNTRVINARMKFRKDTGSVVEIFLLEPVAPEDYALMFQSRGSCSWNCMVGNLKRWKQNPLVKQLDIDGRRVNLSAYRGESRPGNAHLIEFRWDDPDVTFASVVDAAGYIPIPPYLKRESERADADDYQTVYAEIKGSVAAPTAGLHFTPELFAALAERGVERGSVTLHVGAGTFQPVKSGEIGSHPMHTEVFSVDRGLLESLVGALESRRPVTAVGTTSVRTLESLPYIGMHLMKGEKPEVTQWEAYEFAAGDEEKLRTQTLLALRAIIGFLDERGIDSFTAATSIMIAPGFRWRIVDHMVTNFHQPKSTLLLLVASFLGDDGMAKEGMWRRLYREALASDYRFLSYGDACLLQRAHGMA